MRYFLLISLSLLTIAARLPADETLPHNRWVGWGYVGDMLLSQAGDEGRNAVVLQAIEAAKEPIPFFLFSTYLEGDARYATNTKNVAPTTSSNQLIYSHGDSASGVWVDSARMYVLGGEDFVHAQVGVDFINDPLLRSAVLLFGDLKESPFYAAIGIDYVWFSPFISDSAYSYSLNEILFRPGNVPQVVVGYIQDGLEASLTVFSAAYGHGRLHNANQINDFALQASYEFGWLGCAWEVGAGYINNLKAIGSSLYKGSLDFAITDDQNLNRVPAIDAYVRGVWKDFSCIVQYDGAFEGCLQRDGSFTSPQALAIEGEYRFTWKKPMAVVLSYSTTWDADLVADASIPGFVGSGYISEQQQYLLGVTSQIVPHVQVGLEGAYERNYAGGHNVAATANVIVAF